MNAPALCFNKVEKVGRIVEVLRNETFCGFPVVNAKGRVSTCNRLLETEWLFPNRKSLIIYFLVILMNKFF